MKKDVQTRKEFYKAHHQGAIEGSSCLRMRETELTNQEAEFGEAERILDFLRPYRRDLIAQLGDLWYCTEIGEEAFRSWKKQRKNVRCLNRSEGYITANKWFLENHPTAIRLFGPAFLEDVIRDKKKGTNVIVLTALNEDALARALGGEDSLTTQVIFVKPENQFYFYDYQESAFCPTTEEKLKLLLSNMMIICSEACAFDVNREPLFNEFRKPSTLSKIIEVAKSVLVVDADFFTRTNSKRLLVPGMVNPDDKPSYQLFAENIEMTGLGNPTPMVKVCEKYLEFCRNRRLPPDLEMFRKAFPEHVLQIFQIKPRHDVPDEEGKHQRGYFGLKFPEAASILKN